MLVLLLKRITHFEHFNDMQVRIFFLFLVLLVNSFLNAQKIPSEKPKLIVAIVIDQMRYDFIYKYWDKFGNNGFKRLVNEGTICKNAKYNYLLTQSLPGFATIMTGAYPQMHGIIADEWYDPFAAKNVHATKDDLYSCVGCSNQIDKHSPSKILASTFSDELKLSNSNKSKVISVSLLAPNAIMCAGHLANAAYWMVNTSGDWVTSSAYTKVLPAWVVDFNKKKFADIYLEETWRPLLSDSAYNESFPDSNKYEVGIKGKITFPYDLKILGKRTDGRRDYNILAYTPFGNEITKDFAISAIVNENLGKDDYTDFLCINFCVTEIIGSKFGITSKEIEDIYLRLDRGIEHFLSFIDSYVGKGNTLVFLTSSSGASYPTKVMKEWNMPTGVFNQYQALILLKSYLNVLYGNGDWIKFWKNQQIFINRPLVQDSKIDIKVFQKEIANFLLQFSGVTQVATASMLQENEYTDAIMKKMQNSYHPKISGDVIYNLAPGWTEHDESLAIHNTSYNYDAHVPLIFYGWKVSRQTIYDAIDIIDIAPTLSSILNIQFPNACQGKPIEKIIK